MTISAGYQYQGGNVVNTIGIKGGVSKPNELCCGSGAEYIALHINTATREGENALMLIRSGDSFCFRYYVEDGYKSEIDWIDGNVEYDFEVEMLPVKPEPPTAYYAIRFYWRNRSTRESKERTYDFSQNRNPNNVDFALEFDDSKSDPQETSWKCFFNGQVKRHGNDYWEDVREEWFGWYGPTNVIDDVHSEDWTNHKFWQKKELK